MSTNWIRYLKLTAEGGGGSLDFGELRCTFHIQQQPLSSPNLAEIRVYNVSKAVGRRFVQPGSEFKIVTLDAGYQDNHGVICKGNIVAARYGRVTPTETALDLFVNDGDQAHNFATVSKTFAAGSTPKDHFDESVKAMGGHGVKLGHLGIDLSKPKYPKPIVLFGMARDVLHDIAGPREAMWSIQNHELQMVDKDKPIPGGAVKLNSDSGMIGMATQEIDWITVKCLINPQIKVNGTVHIDEASIQRARPISDLPNGWDSPQNSLMPDIAADGLYKVLKIDFQGDTRGTVWYQTLACRPLKDTGPGTKTSVGYEGSQ